MRLERFALTRFGHFTDVTIDFGASPRDDDLHIVYGANEAGKSTTLAALIDLFYGMPRQSPHAHRHDYKTLELGGRLHQNGSTLDIRRYKNTLTDASGERLDENAIDLHGVSREAFGARFSFDRDALQKGGESMLANRGELGEALFSASAGIPDIQRRLAAVMEPSNRFWEPGRAAGKTLTALLAELAEVEAGLATVDTDAKAWRALKAQAETAATASGEADARVALGQRRIRERERERAALGSARQRQLAKAALADLDGVPDTPPDWLARLRALAPRHTVLDAGVVRARADLQRLDAELAAITIDEPLLALAPRVTELEGELSAERERAERIAALGDLVTEHERRIASRRESLGAPASLANDALLPRGDALSAIERLVREHEGLDATRCAAREEHDRLLERRSALADETVEAPDPTPLQSLLAHVRDATGGGAVEMLEARWRDAGLELETALEALRPWQGDADALRGLAVPGAADRESRRRALDEAREQRRRLATSDEEQASRHAERLRERHALAGDDALDDAHAEALRARRDAAWRAHAGALDDETSEHRALRHSARAFFETLVEDDTLAARRLSASERVARLRRLDVELAADATEDITRKTRRAEAEAALDAAGARLADEAVALGLPASTLSADVDDWLVRREQALTALARHRKAADEREAAGKRRDAHLARLQTLLKTFATPDAPAPLDGATLEELLAFADARVRVLVEAAESDRRQVAERDRLTRESASRAQALGRCEAALEAWGGRWETALDGHWLGERDVTAVGAHLDTLRSLADTLAALSDDTAERARLTAERTRFLARVRAVLEAGGEGGDDAEDALPSRLAALSRRVADMRERQASRRRLAAARDAALAEAEALEKERLPLGVELDAMRHRCGVGTVAELDAVLERVRERRDREREIEEAGDRLREALDADSVEAALSRLADLDRDTLDDDIARLERELDHAQREAGEHRLTLGRANESLSAVTGDDAVVQLAERRAHLLLEIGEGAIDTLRMRLGKEAVLDGVRRYRDRHRGSLLDGARDAFVALTLERYADLQTRPDDKGEERLRAVSLDGRSLETDQLSDGTRFQLYLALRIAAYHEYATHRVPLPFVADDVMESFDEARTAAAIGLLAGMGRKGQVVYLTHHRRVVEIAREVCGERVQVHELPEPARPGE